LSTRATYEFIDEHNRFTVYKHHDGDPSGGVSFIAEARKLAWELPRFEASDFGAAFIAVNKVSGGGVRLTVNRDYQADTDYHYEVKCFGGTIWVEIFERVYETKREYWKTVDLGPLDELYQRYCVRAVVSS